MGALESVMSDSVRMIRAEYLEMPGLNLTRRQVQRLWSLDAAHCDALLAALVASRFLRRTQSDAYVRSDGGA